MTTYLEKLLLRVNGQLPVIKPVVRSNYGALPVINESKSEIEETVSFNEVDSTPYSDNRTAPNGTQFSPGVNKKNIPVIIQDENKKHPDHSGKVPSDMVSNMVQGKINQPLATPKALLPESKPPAEQVKAHPEMHPTILPNGIPAQQTAPTTFREQSNPSIKSLVQNASLIQKTNPAIASNKIASSLEKKRATARQTPEGSSSPTRKTAQTNYSEQNSRYHISNENPKSFSEKHTYSESLPSNTESITDRQPDNESRLSRLEHVDKIASRNLVKQPYTSQQNSLRSKGETLYYSDRESTGSRSPTTNITVTIGRVEIKAVTQTHPATPPVQVNSKAKEPVISLESYLKNRDEARL
jgi:hypothetical protein